MLGLPDWPAAFAQPFSFSKAVGHKPMLSGERTGEIAMIHVIFSPSAAGTLRQALPAQGKREHVVELTEHLDWGPISPSGLFQTRGAWLDQNIPWGDNRSWTADAAWDDTGWDWLHSGPRQFQSKLMKDRDRLIWLASGSASEQCGLYWYLDRFGGDDASMIVASEPPSSDWRGPLPCSLGELNVGDMSGLLDQAPREEWNARRFSPTRWRELCDDASFLRIIDQGKIRSVPEDHFDGHLLACCPQNWQKCLRVVGNAMVNIWQEHHSVDTVFLIWRLRVLAARGKITSTGEITAFPETASEPILIRATKK